MSGQTDGSQKSLSLSDTLGLPKRIVYLQEKGVFLNEFQEQITLEKLLWKERYKQDAVAMYWVNKALEERINEVIARNKELREELNTAESRAITAVSQMEHYRGLYKDTEIANNKLRADLASARMNNKLWKIGTFTGIAAAAYFGLNCLFPG